MAKMDYYWQNGLLLAKWIIMAKMDYYW